MKKRIITILMLMAFVASMGLFASSCKSCDEPKVEDVVAPVITISSDSDVINARLGEPLTLPTATATDDVDGDVDVTVYGEVSGMVSNGTFTSHVLGNHTVTYYAVDSSGNETFKDITVKVSSDTVVETFDVSGYYDISALASDGGIFKENFQDGYNSPLIRKALQGEEEIRADANTISGNSLVLDYSKCEGKENRIFLTNLMPYFKSGEWEISFDVKLVRGTPFSDFYFGYVQEGTVTSKDQQYSLADMAVGEVKRIEWKQLLDLDEDAQYFVHIFRLNQAQSESYDIPFDQVLAFDNFVIKYVEKVYKKTVPTLEQLAEGFTFNWSTVYTSVSGGVPERVNEIENAAAKQAISDSADFGDTVMHLTGSGAHDIASITKNDNPDFFQVGCVYNFELYYYAVNVGTCYMIVYDGTAGNRLIKQGPFSVGLNKLEVEYVVKANETNITFYGEMDVYLGNFKITYNEPVETETLVDKEIKGTKNWSDCRIAAGKFTVIQSPTSETGFDAEALQFVAETPNYTMELFRMVNLISGDKYYKSTTFTIYYYVSEITGTGLYINIDNKAFYGLESSLGYHAVTVEVDSEMDFFCLYVDGSTTGTFVVGSVDYIVYTQEEVT